MGTLLFVAIVAVGCWLFWMLMDEVFEAVSHHGARDEVKRLRRDFVERRLGGERRDPRRGSPPPAPAGSPELALLARHLST